MDEQELIEAFLSGEMGDVEFFEEATEAGLDWDLITKIMVEHREGL